MTKWKRITLDPLTPIIQAIQIIDNGGMQIGLVVNQNNRLLGTVTDGDIRRGILKGIPMDEPVQLIMNPKPTVARIDDDKEDILAKMKIKRLHQIPVVDQKRCLVSVETLDNLIQTEQRDNWVVLMAGGLGSRLRPLTDQCPKPLLKVGGKPILETIIESFLQHGFCRFYISVNYKANMIEEYFGDGSQWGADIRYIREDRRMGTAGALGLLPEKPSQPILIMNGDLLTKVNFQHLLDFHIENKAKATMCVREYNYQVPYGVVKVDKQHLIEIIEKPVQRFFVNAGIYVLDPKVLKIIPKNEYFDMPSLFSELNKTKHETCVFPVREYWIDIGQKIDFEKANGEFSGVFA